MLTLRSLVKAFDDRSAGKRATFVAVDGVDLDVEEGKFYTLLGPSGCGKTTTLRMVAGLEEPDAGVIQVAGRTLFSSQKHVNVAAHRRGLGMVFQSYAIWPNMTVSQNIAFSLKGRGVKGRKRLKRKDISERVEWSLDLVDLSHLADRPATKLSGGQQQRLALARALAIEPAVLLLDEPLSNLDQKLREKMRLRLKRMQRDLGVTTLFVTHDQLEAMALSNVVAVMNQGKIEQSGVPREVYNFPETRFVADFVGRMNFLDGKVDAHTGGDEYLVRTPEGALCVRSASELAVGSPVTVTIRPENVVLEQDEPAEQGPNVWGGELERREFLGEWGDFHVRVGASTLIVRSDVNLPVHTGDKVTLRLPAEQCAVIREDG